MGRNRARPNRTVVFAVVYSLGLAILLTVPLGIVHSHPRGYLREFPGSLKRGIADVLVNVLLFVPIGWSVHRILNGVLATVFTGGLFSLSVETLQYFLETRYSSLVDVASNVLGSGVGAFIDRRAWLRSR